MQALCPSYAMSGARSTRPSPESGFTKVTCIPGQPFDQEIRSALARLNLNFQVPHVDFAGGEVYLVGNEIGLSGRFINNVCVPVAKVLANSSQSSLVIGDVQAFLLTPEVVPDVSIGVTMKNDDGITEVKVVGEFKTFWTLELAELSVSDPISRVQLAPHLGMWSSPLFHPTVTDISHRAACGTDEEL